MAHYSELSESNFLRRLDVAQRPLLLTIKAVEKMEVTNEGRTEEKWCLAFVEPVKPLILKPVHGEAIARITGQDDWDNWGGHKIVAYDDPNVTFGRKLVGGIRVRAPRMPASATPIPQPQLPYQGPGSATATLRDRAEAAMPKPIGDFIGKPELPVEVPGEDPY